MSMFSTSLVKVVRNIRFLLFFLQKAIQKSFIFFNKAYGILVKNLEIFSVQKKQKCLKSADIR